MKIEWKEDAIEDLARNVEFYAETNPVVAFEVFDDVRERAKVLGDQPDIGRRGRKTGTKELVLKGTPFILVYQVKSDQVAILRVLHGAQLWPPKDQ